MSLRSMCTGLALSAAAGTALGACSLAVDFTECRADSDCGYDGEQGSCVDGKCVAPPETTGDPTSEGDPSGPSDPTSSTTEEPTTEAPTTDPPDTTTDAITGTDTDPTTDTDTDTDGACAGTTECEASLGEGYLCIAGACVNALTDQCQQLVWPSTGSHDQVVLIGSIMATSPPFDGLVVPLQNALQLAIEDYNRTTDLPGGNKIAWLACDDGGKVDAALAAAEHLSGTLGISAIVGPIFSEQVIAVSEQVTVPAGTLIITPTATNKAITTLEDDGLVWRTITSDVYQSNAVADRVLELDPPAAKLALLGKDDAYGNGVVSDVMKRLDVPLGDGLTTHKYPDPVSKPPQDIMAEYGLVLSQAWGPEGDHPDTMVFAGTSEVENLILGVLLLWSGENPPPPLPRFIVTHGAVPSMEDTINDPKMPVALKQAMMMLLEGTAPVIFDPENFAAFNQRYKLRFNELDAITASSLSYDAGMVVMMAMAAVPEGEPVTGAAIRDNIAKLVDKAGTKVSFGEVDGLDLTFLSKAHDALISGGSVDLQGVSGELDFDLVTGEVRTDILGWGLVPKQNMPDVPVLTPLRIYTLNPPPAEVGAWSEL